jgi:hypothetical protein
MLAKPAAKAMADIESAVSSTRRLARCTVLRDWTGAYGPALMTCAALQLLAAVLIVLGPGRKPSST